MLEHSKRPLQEKDHKILDHYRLLSIGDIDFPKKYTILIGNIAGGIFVGFFFEKGNFHDWIWLAFAACVLGAFLLGFGIDLFQVKKRRAEKVKAAAEYWDSIVSIGVVHSIKANASRAIRIDDHQSDTLWFLQVSKNQILCVWDYWIEGAKEEVEVDWIPSKPLICLTISWSGKTLSPLRPKRKFKAGERQPEQCEILEGTLDEIDELIRSKKSNKKNPKRKIQNETSEGISKLSKDLESIGFYKNLSQNWDRTLQLDFLTKYWAFGTRCKYITAEGIAEADVRFRNVYDWYSAVGRGFEADPERLAEGGVGDLLDFLRPALKAEGWELGLVENLYDAEGYRIRIDDHVMVLWVKGEEAKSWDLTLIRIVDWIQQGLEKAGSKEQIYLLGDGHDSTLILLTPAMLQMISESGLFPRQDLPVPIRR
ncbi:hypothetical protein AB3N59_06960 [Leptospira sp. WS92.C1]